MPISLPFGLAKRKGSIRRMPFSTNEFNPENHYKINESEEEKMSKFEALEIVKEYEARKENWKNVPKGCSFVKEDEREMRRQYNAALRVLSC